MRQILLAQVKKLRKFVILNYNDFVTTSMLRDDAWYNMEIYSSTRSPYGWIMESSCKISKISFTYRTLKEPNLNYDFYTTLLILNKIECLFNSRPMCPLSSDPNNPKFLPQIIFYLEASWPKWNYQWIALYQTI